MTTTPGTLPKLTTRPSPYDPHLNRLMIGDDELTATIHRDRAAEIVRRCNDYPALAARLEKAMGLLRRIRDTNDSLTGYYDADIAALLAEHEQETRP